MRIDVEPDDLMIFEAESELVEPQRHRPDDITVYSLREQNQGVLPDSDASAEFDLVARDGASSPPLQVGGRALVCRCFRGALASATLRVTNPGRDATVTGYDLDPRPGDSNWLTTSPFRPKEESSSQFLFSMKALVDRLYDDLFVRAAPRAEGTVTPRTAIKPAGLLAITGRTASGKSQLARGLIFSYLRDLSLDFLASLGTDKTKRRPHLLTLEDPVEKWLFEGGDEGGGSPQPGDPETALAVVRHLRSHGLDYTPRELKKDVVSLEVGFREALRQTPAVVYAGEIRRDEDWLAAAEFAATGHLVVTTGHAGSLVETMTRILRCLDARTPAARGQCAERIFSLIHLSTFEHEGFVATLPSVWRRTPGGIADLVTDGLSSIVPFNHTDASAENQSALGRASFVDRMTPTLSQDSARVAAILEELRGQALAADLEGM